VNAAQRLFLVQAISDFAVFKLLRDNADLPPCHALHYLQMATELLAKAFASKHGPVRKSHQGFVPFIRTLASNRKAQEILGYEGQNYKWEHMIRKSVPLAEQIENLAPSLSKNRPNPEYPWPDDNPTIAPVEHDFDLWRNLEKSPEGRSFLHLVRQLFASADTFV